MRIVIRGAGDIASGIALRLFHAGMQIIMLETPAPTTIRRTVSFSPAAVHGRATVEDVTALRAQTMEDARRISSAGHIALLVDPSAASCKPLQPDALVDAILAKKNLGTSVLDAPIVIAVGPGFTAGQDCHAVVETQRGHTLGRVLLKGSALTDTGIPGNIGGYTSERLLRAPAEGVFTQHMDIGARVQAGDVVGNVAKLTIDAKISGVLRGILPSGTYVYAGMKCGDIDPRCEVAHCYTVSDKALAVGGGVLEALLRLNNRL